LKCVSAYTAVGAISSVLVGSCLGQVGHWFGGKHISVKLYVLSLLSALLAFREWGWIRFYLPERRRQTEKVWAHQFGFVWASAMWGFHVGLGFATWATFGVFWIVVALAFFVASPLYGALIMVVYWLGRSLSVWLASSVIVSPSAALKVPRIVLRNQSTYRRMAGLALVWSSGIAILLALRVESWIRIRLVSVH